MRGRTLRQFEAGSVGRPRLGFVGPVLLLVAQGLAVSVVPVPLQRSGMAGAVFRPLAEATLPSELFCAWNAAHDPPARRQFLALVLPAA